MNQTETLVCIGEKLGLPLPVRQAEVLYAVEHLVERSRGIEEGSGRVKARLTQVEARLAEAEQKLKTIDLAIAEASKRGGFAPTGETLHDVRMLGFAIERAVDIACRIGVARARAEEKSGGANGGA